MTAEIVSHKRKLDERIRLRGEKSTVELEKKDYLQRSLHGDFQELDRSTQLTWELKGYAIRVDSGATIHNDIWKTIYVLRDGAEKEVAFPEPAKLSEFLTAEEKRAMEEAIDELNEWHKYHPHLPDIMSMVFEIAVHAKPTER